MVGFAGQSGQVVRASWRPVLQPAGLRGQQGASYFVAEDFREPRPRFGWRERAQLLDPRAERPSGFYFAGSSFLALSFWRFLEASSCESIA